MLAMLVVRFAHQTCAQVRRAGGRVRRSMAEPDELRGIVVIGASAGGVEALRTLVAGLPIDIDAAILVALHIPPFAQSTLPAILNRAGALPAAQASDAEPLRAGRIYVAPP